MKKYITTLGALSALFVLVSCANNKAVDAVIEAVAPTINYESTSLKKVSLQSATILVNTSINNPNPIGTTLTGYDYNVSIADVTVLNQSVNETMSIGAKASSALSIPITIEYARYRDLVNSLGKNDIPYTIALTPKVDVAGLGSLPLPLSIKGVLPNIKVPTLEDISIKSLGMQNNAMRFAIDAQIINPNNFSLLLNALNANVLLGGKQVASIASLQTNPIGSNGSEKWSFSADVPASSLQPQMLMKLLSGNTDLVKLDGALEFKTDAFELDGFALPFNPKK